MDKSQHRRLQIIMIKYVKKKIFTSKTRRTTKDDKETKVYRDEN